MEQVKPRELLMAARLADALVYVVGLAGVVAGGVLYRNDQLPFAIVAWVLTFVAGATLRLAAWMARGIAEILHRQTLLGDELRDVRADRVAAERRGDAGQKDPYGRWGWHH